MARLWTLAVLTVSLVLAAAGCCMGGSSAPAPAPTLTPTPTPTPVAPPSAPAAGGEAVPASFGVAECDAYAAKACNCSNAMLRPNLCQAARQSFESWRQINNPAAQAALGQGCAQAATSLASACP